MNPFIPGHNPMIQLATWLPVFFTIFRKNTDGRYYEKPLDREQKQSLCSLSLDIQGLEQCLPQRGAQ